MVFGPWLEAFVWFKNLRPSFATIRNPHFNFITLHYFYMISLTLLGSVILYGSKNIAYIDALFFASGCATQSGLNTINVNQLYTYQQVVMYFVGCIGNPIFINTMVVFVRLYWFEKRFQNVVLEAQRFRRSRSRTRTMSESEAKEEHDYSLEERGVGDRTILVMHPGPKTMLAAQNLVDNDPDRPTEKMPHGDHSTHSMGGSSSSGEGEGLIVNGTGAPLPIRREITFADEIRPAPQRDSDSDRMPVQRTAEQHIAFLENQRNPKDKGVLYIPGPRDFDRGDLPKHMEDDIVPGNMVQTTRTGEPYTPQTPIRSRFRSSDDDASSYTDRPLRSKIAEKLTFEDAAHVVSKAKHWKSLLNSPPAEEGSADTKQAPSGLRNRTKTFASFLSTSKDDIDPMPYLTYQPTVGRNSTFVNLTEAQREELGGIEYRALKTLVIILCTYFLGFHLLGVVCLVPWFVRSATYGPIAEADGFSRVWWGIFTPASMFNDLGYTLNPDSMISFQRAVFPLLLGSFLIVIGNTGFPCMLRFVIWIVSKLVPNRSSVWEELKFLLDHPRRCFTLLFPSKATWWLFWVLVILNSVDLVFFIILDLHDPIITSLPPGIRVLDGLFQAASTRTAGFADVNLAQLHPGIQVSYLVMMYISVLPIAISIRRTNVYEEKSLGIWGSDGQDEESEEQSYVGAHLRRQLSFDLWYVFLGLFVIAIVEGDRLAAQNDPSFTLFAVLFEVVSAYGTVGLSLGYPTIDASFSGEFHVLSKLVIIAMQIRGRHRGLPYALDKAILLPSEGLHKKEEADANRRASRRNSMISLASFPPDPAVRGLAKSHSVMTQESGNKKTRRGGWSRLISQALTAGPTNGKMREND